MKQAIFTLIAICAAMTFLWGCASPEVVVRDRGNRIQVTHPDGSNVQIQMDPQQGTTATASPVPSSTAEQDQRAKELAHDIAAKQNTLAELQAKAVALGEQIPLLANQKRQLEAQLTDLKQQLAKLESAKAEAAKPLGDLNEQSARLRQQIVEQQKQLQELALKATQTQQELAAKQGQLAELQAKAGTIEAQIPDLKQQLAGLAAAKVEAAGSLGQLKEQAAQQRQRIDEQQRQVSALAAEIDHLKAIEQDLSKSVSEAKTQQKDQTGREPALVATPVNADAPASHTDSAMAAAATTNPSDLNPEVNGASGATAGVHRSLWQMLWPWILGVGGTAAVISAVGFATWLSRPKVWQVRITRPATEAEPAIAEDIQVCPDEVIDLSGSRPRSVARETDSTVYLRVNHFGKASLHSGNGAQIRINGKNAESFPTAILHGDRIEIAGKDDTKLTHVVSDITGADAEDDEDAVTSVGE